MKLQINARILKKAKENNIPYTTLIGRLKNNVIPELLLTPVVKNPVDNKTSTDWEAWSGLTDSQLETMREFEQIGRIAKY